MIVSKHTHPERDLYYLGAEVIKILERSTSVKQDYFELYNSLKKSCNISIYLYSLTLDWLYLLGVIKQGEKGFIEKCF